MESVPVVTELEAGIDPGRVTSPSQRAHTHRANDSYIQLHAWTLNNELIDEFATLMNIKKKKSHCDIKADLKIIFSS